MTLSLRIMSGFAATVAAVALMCMSPPTSVASAATPTCDGRTATIVGTDGPDHLTGTPHQDVIVAFGGDDTIDGAGSADIVCAGDGDDTVSVVGGFVHGGPGDDDIRQVLPRHAHTQRGRLYGDAGDDNLECSGTCMIYGGSGHDRLVGGPSEQHGNLLAGGSGSDVLVGGSHHDTFVFSRGHDKVHGRGGESTLDLSFANSGVRADLAAGTATNSTGRTTVKHIADVYGSPYQDHLLGDRHANLLVDDFSAADVINGRGGDDRVSAQFSSESKVSGGKGADTVIAQETPNPNKPILGAVVDLAKHVGYNRHHKAKKTRLAGIENVIGTEGPDIIRGDAGPNVIQGGNSVDRLYGRAGGDRIYGSEITFKGGSADHANGGAGNDLCVAKHTTHCERS
jgi:Ca2+-binding RTX toxin-like protein